MLQPDQKDDAPKIVAATSTELNAVEPIDETAVPVGDGKYSKTAFIVSHLATQKCGA